MVLRYLQDEGEYPARIVMDLWASPTLRTGGEDVAHALALMGVRPVWDHASTRVTGFEVLPLALLDRPRIDVTVRVSGVFRDTFPDTLSLLDRAAPGRRPSATRSDDENPLAAARAPRRGAGPDLRRAHPAATAPGPARLALDGAWDDRDELGRAYLAASEPRLWRRRGRRRCRASPRGSRRPTPMSTPSTWPSATCSTATPPSTPWAVSPPPRRWPAARRRSTASTSSNPEAPRARTAREESPASSAAARPIRAGSPAQLRHGYRGAQELAQGVDAVFVLAATTDAVSDADFDRLYGALIADTDTFDALRAANPAASRAILERFDEARTRGLWSSRRNAMAADD